jgi:hypothetical protein
MDAGINAGSGTWLDQSGNSNNASINGPTIIYDTDMGWVYDFDGVDDYIDLGNLANFHADYPGKHTISLWFKATRLNSTLQAIFTDNYGPEWGLWIHTNNQLRGAAYGTTYATISADTW